MFLSAAGLYSLDRTIFDEMQLPEGVDKDCLIFDILAETAELEIIYPSASFFRTAIYVWSKKELPVWEKMFATTKLEYNPIENYDRMEEWEDDSNVKTAAFNDGLVDSGSGATKHTGRLHGNIGVTTTQQMIEEERRVAQWTLHDHIIREFKRRFCVLVY